MSALIAEVSRKVDQNCVTRCCSKEDCSVLLKDAPPKRVIVDLDRSILPIPTNQKRCDYLFLGEQNSTNWVVPIELKGGKVDAQTALEQLQGGAAVANVWLPHRNSFKFVPILAHGKGIHSRDLASLRRNKISLRGQQRQVVLVRCGAELGTVLA